MPTTLILCFAAVAIVLLALAKAAGKKKAASEDRYSAKNLLTENEKQWFNAIREAVPNAHVFAQVALNQLVKPEGKARTSAYVTALNKIGTRSIDFVLLNPDLAVLMAIEIDDKTHKQQKRQNDDEKKNKALRDADITLMRFPATPVLSSEVIKKRFVETIAAKMHAKSAAKTT